MQADSASLYTNWRKIMAVSQPRYSKEEFARRGDEIYERDLCPHVEAGNEGKFIVIDIETGAYEIDADELDVCFVNPVPVGFSHINL